MASFKQKAIGITITVGGVVILSTSGLVTDTCGIGEDPVEESATGGDTDPQSETSEDTMGSDVGTGGEVTGTSTADGTTSEGSETAGADGEGSTSAVGDESSDGEGGDTGPIAQARKPFCANLD